MTIFYALGLIVAMFAGAGLTIWAQEIIGQRASRGHRGKPVIKARPWLPKTDPPPADDGHPYYFQNGEPRYGARPYLHPVPDDSLAETDL